MTNHKQLRNALKGNICRLTKNVAFLHNVDLMKRLSVVCMASVRSNLIVFSLQTKNCIRQT